MPFWKKKNRIEESTSNQLSRIANALEQGLSNKAKKSDETDNEKAAYALNMCLVSVSQIIDYNDIYVLEQEYTNILNNLNLENMPKDDELLDIYRQLLDTITFFRIQEKDKFFIEKKHQEKLKAAIWKSVPNCTAIFATSDPKAMLMTLLTQVGIGYMNYRNVKAEENSEHEEKMWELEKAAIEQFNGLRRELFTTAWKLAEKYKFGDELRITETQIEYYNQVLQEQNVVSKFESLEDIENQFGAYPPFWYFKGHTALELFQQTYLDEYKKKAIDAYEKYFAINDGENKLLRTDPFYSICALEYSSLIENEQEKSEYISKAVKNAGHQNDILQMCASAYLDIGDCVNAAKIIRKLVRSDYNVNLNAQLLSAVYISDYLKGHNPTIEQQYITLKEILQNRINIIDWPKEAGSNFEKQYESFVASRKSGLIREYARFIQKYYSKKTLDYQIDIIENAPDKEKAFVQFVLNILSDLNSFPFVEISEETFIDLVKQKQVNIEKWIKEKHSPVAFDEIFGDIFIRVSQEIAKVRLDSMETISNFEIELANTMSSHLKKELNSYNANTDVVDTLAKLFGSETEQSQRFKNIKAIIANSNVLNTGAKNVEILISGEVRFNRYVKDHNLSSDNPIAIINDKSFKDVDLIFTEHGLFTEIASSKPHKLVRWLTTLGVYDVTADVLERVFGKTVLYSEVRFKHDKNVLDKPYYKNKEINMAALMALIDKIKSEPEDESIESQLYKNIVGA